MARVTASQERQLQYLTIDDFSPGIWTSSTYGPLGSASGAIGCGVDQNKALVAGPGQAQFIGISDTLGEATSAADPVILAFRVVSNIFPFTTEPSTVGPSDQLFLIYQYWDRATGPGTAWHEKTVFKTIRPFDTPTQYVIHTSDVPSNVFADVWATDGAPFIYGWAGLDISRASTADATIPGNVFVAGVGMPFGELGGTAFQFAYPKVTTPTVDSQEAMVFKGNNIANIVAHQDRIVGFRGPVTGGGITTVAWPSTDNFLVNTAYSELLDFTAVNNYRGVANILLVGEENPMGYGAWGSMNANQLFLVKHTGGAISITGPLENPTVTRLPGVTPTKGVTSIGCVMPNGTFVYGAVDGVYAWSGGDTSQQISAPLGDSWFWNANTDINVGNDKTTLPILGPTGKFAYQHPYLYCPGGMIYDDRFGSWWQLNGGQGIGWWDNGATTFGVGFQEPAASVWGCVLTAPVNVFDQIAAQFQNGLSDSWTWSSTPLPISQGREIAVREIRITYRGSALTVSLTSDTDSQTPIALPVATNTMPHTVTIPVKCDGSDVRVTLTGDIVGKVFRVSIGYHERQTARGTS